MATLGGIVTLLAAFAGGFLMALGHAGEAAADPEPMPWPQAAYFPSLLLAAVLALTAAAVTWTFPRLASLTGFAAVFVGAVATVVCVYAVQAELLTWALVTAPVTIAALMGLLARRPRSERAQRIEAPLAPDGGTGD